MYFMFSQEFTTEQLRPLFPHALVHAFNECRQQGLLDGNMYQLDALLVESHRLLAVAGSHAHGHDSVMNDACRHCQHQVFPAIFDGDPATLYPAAESSSEGSSLSFPMPQDSDYYNLERRPSTRTPIDRLPSTVYKDMNSTLGRDEPGTSTPARQLSGILLATSDSVAVGPTGDFRDMELRRLASSAIGYAWQQPSIPRTNSTANATVPGSVEVPLYIHHSSVLPMQTPSHANIDLSSLANDTSQDPSDRGDVSVRGLSLKCHAAARSHSVTGLHQHPP